MFNAYETQEDGISIHHTFESDSPTDPRLVGAGGPSDGRQVSVLCSVNCGFCRTVFVFLNLSQRTSSFIPAKQTTVSPPLRYEDLHSRRVPVRVRFTSPLLNFQLT